MNFWFARVKNYLSSSIILFGIGGFPKIKKKKTEFSESLFIVLYIEVVDSLRTVFFNNFNTRIFYDNAILLHCF